MAIALAKMLYDTVLQISSFKCARGIDPFDNHSQLFSKNRIFVTQSDIYKYMKKKTQHLSIRLTNQQYQKLIQVLKTERLTKSELVRLALSDYISEE